MRLTIDVPDWLVKRTLRVAKSCPPESDWIVQLTDLSFMDAFELIQLVIEAAAEAALDSPEAAEPLEEDMR